MPGPAPHLAAGKLRAIGVTGQRRLPNLPDVPTLAEQGVTGMDVNSWWGFVAPSGLPDARVRRLNEEITRALADTEVKAIYTRMGIEPSPGSPEAFGAHIMEEFGRWKALITRLDLPLE
jgi:tripartite-type tricarboxylate transporter receptor subunit TctC